MTTTTYQVTGMSCGHCEASVRSEIAKIDGVQSIDVSADSGVLTIESDAALSDDDVLAAVDEAGYDASRS